MSLIAGTFRSSSSLINPSSLQCLLNNDWTASPSDACGYSNDDVLKLVAAERQVVFRAIFCCRAMNGIDLLGLLPRDLVCNDTAEQDEDE